jgi:hypothetical protein
MTASIKIPTSKEVIQKWQFCCMILLIRYIIPSDNIRKDIELSEPIFSEEMIEEMGQIADGMYYLKLGLDDEYDNGYGITANGL